VPDFVVIPTAPSYLFWRCPPPPELRVYPMEWFAGLPNPGQSKVAIGPHPSATPAATIRKTWMRRRSAGGEPDQTLSLNSPAGHGQENRWLLLQEKTMGEFHISPGFSRCQYDRAGARLDFKNYKRRIALPSAPCIHR